MNKMFSIILFLMTLIALLPADIPQKISYQGVLLDSETNELLEGAYDLTFKLYDSESNELWSETQSTEMTGGVFNVLLGSVTPLDLSFDEPYFMGITVNDDPELSPRIELSSSAYSFTTGSILDGVAVKSINDLKDDILITGGENVTVAQSGNSLIISSNALGGDSDNDWVRVGDTLYSAPDSTVTIRNEKVGIGTLNPFFKFDVVSEIAPNADLSADAHFSNRSGNGGGLAIMTGDSIALFLATSNEGGDMNIGFTPYKQGVNYTEALRINADGKVGIGTVNPSSKLEVTGQIKITGGNPGTGKVLTSDGSGLAAWQTPTGGGGADSDWIISGNNLYSQPSGNVGIGVTSPLSKLDVAASNTTAISATSSSDHSISGTSSASTKAGVKGLSTSNSGFGVYGDASSGGDAVYGTSTTGTAGRFEADGSGTAGFFYSSAGHGLVVANGNTGLGTTSPTSKLEVVGTIRTQSGSNAGGAVDFGGGTNNNKISYSGNVSNDGYMKFDAGGTTRMVIDATSGNMGIGTTSPGTKFEVAGQVKITGGTPGAGKVLTSDTSGLASWQTPSITADNDWTISGNNLYSQPSGNVGIGTNNPISKLEVAGSNSTAISATSSGNHAITGNSSTPGKAGVMGTSSGSGGHGVFGDASTGNAVYGVTSTGIAGRFESDDNGTAGFFRSDSGYGLIVADGNVGIGLTNPQSPLSVSGYIETDYALLLNNSLNGHSQIGLFDSTLYIHNFGAGSIELGTDTSVGSANPRLVIKGDGKIGIGTQTPSAKLEVNGNIKLTYNNAGTKILVGSDELISAQYGLIKINGGPSPWTNVSIASGNVGIGTTSPNTKLEVAGQVKITGGSPGSGKVLTSDASGIATWQTPSGGGTDNDWTISGNNMYSQPSGNVGIGTTNPSEKLHVNGGILSDGIGISHSNGVSFLIPSSNDLLFGNGASGGLYFSTVNETRLAITSNGLIGIGTTSPTEKLEVNGNIKLAYNNSGTKILVGSDELISAQTGIIKINNGPSPWSKVAITNGNFGIGTTNPSTKLEVAGQVKITGGSPGSGKVLTSDANGLATWQPLSGVTDSDWTVSGNNLYSQPSGNVGIGTTNPLSKMVIVGGNNTGLHVTSTSSYAVRASSSGSEVVAIDASVSDSASTAIRGTDIGLFSNGKGIEGLSYTGTAGYFKSTNGYGVIVENGNVGIGTLTPSAQLEVNGNIKLTYNNAGTKILVGSDELISAQYGLIKINGGPSPWTNVSIASGNFGIGTTSPSHPLHMGSGAYVSSGGVWTNASSRSLKENIFDLSLHDALKALKNITPVTFNYKNQKEETYAGFIAEDVPELVAMNDRASLSSMDIVAVLTKVLQEQQRINQDQQKEIDALKAQINNITAPVNQN